MSKVKLLLYCTKSKPYLYGHYIGFETLYHYDLTNDKKVFDRHKVFNGIIVAECDCEKAEEICCEMLDNGVESYPIYYTETLDCIEESSCLDTNDLANYLPQKIGGEKVGYAIHLSNLKIFDIQFAIEEFYKDNFPKIYEKWEDHQIKKAPQNMCYCYDINGNKYILISIRPEYLFEILNGKKTIEVRKQILKELKEQIENE